MDWDDDDLFDPEQRRPHRDERNRARDLVETSDEEDMDEDFEESSQECFCLLDGYKTSLTVEWLSGTLPKSCASKNAGSRQQQNLPIGDIPVHCISFKDLDLSGLEKLNKSDNVKIYLASIRNYLIGKQKGPDQEKRAITVFAGLDNDNANKVQFFLKLDEEFAHKLKNYLKDVSVYARLEIGWQKEGRETQGEDERVYESLSDWFLKANRKIRNRDKVYYYDHHDASGVRPSKMIGLESSRISLSDLGRGGIMADGLETYKDKTRRLEFNWDVMLTFEKDPEATEPFQLDSECILENMYALSDASKEVSIVAKNGAEVKCHRSILMAQSASFNSMLCPARDMIEGRTGRIDMPENSEDGLRLFVKLLYGFEAPEESLTPDLAIELFQLSHKYEVKGLEEFFIEFLIRKGMDFYTPDAILELYFSVRNIKSLEGLRVHALTEMSQLKEDTLRSCEYFKKLSPDEAVSLVFKLLEWK